MGILFNHDVSDLKSEKNRVGDFQFKVISKSDLLKMKKKSGRDKDLIDPQLLHAFKLKFELGKRPYTTKIKELMQDFLDKGK